MIIYKDILKKLNTAGYNTNRLRKERLLSESTIQGIREGKPLTAKTIDTVCLLLNCQPNNIMQVVKGEAEKKSATEQNPIQSEPEDEPQAETFCEDNTDHLLELQAAIEAKKAAQDKAAEDAQRAEEERIEREKAENVAEIMAIAERIRSGEELKEDPEKEQARNVSKVLANTQYYQ